MIYHLVIGEVCGVKISPRGGHLPCEAPTCVIGLSLEKEALLYHIETLLRDYPSLWNEAMARSTQGGST